MSTLTVKTINFEPTGSVGMRYAGNGVVAIVANSGFQVPFGNTSTRGPGNTAIIRYNTDTGNFETYNGASWGAFTSDAKANLTYDQSNAAYLQSNTAFNKANAVYTISNGVYDAINIAFNATNTAYDFANAISSKIGNETVASSTYYPTFISSTTGSLTDVNVSSTKLTFTPSTGTLSSTIYNSLSDATLKENVEGIDGVALLNKINPVTFTWKDSGIKSYGVIAQELEESVPELVDMMDNGLKTVSYLPIIAILVDVVKKQQKTIDKQQKDINRIMKLLNNK